MGPRVIILVLEGSKCSSAHSQISRSSEVKITGEKWQAVKTQLVMIRTTMIGKHSVQLFGLWSSHQLLPCPKEAVAGPLPKYLVSITKLSKEAVADPT